MIVRGRLKVIEIARSDEENRSLDWPLVLLLVARWNLWALVSTRALSLARCWPGPSWSRCSTLFHDSCRLQIQCIHVAIVFRWLRHTYVAHIHCTHSNNWNAMWYTRGRVNVRPRPHPTSYNRSAVALQVLRVHLARSVKSCEDRATYAADQSCLWAR